MVYMEPEQLGWGVLLDSWLQMFFHPHDENEPVAGVAGEDGSTAHPHSKFTLLQNEVDLVRALFQWLAEPCMAFLRRELSEMAPSVDAQLMRSLMNIMECLLVEALKGNFGIGEDADAKQKKMRRQHIECAFFFGLVWSVCKTGGDVSQEKFSEYLRSIVENLDYIKETYPGVINALAVRKWDRPTWEDAMDGSFVGKLVLPLPSRGTIFDYVYIPKDGKWHSWVDILPSFEIADNTEFANIVVPTMYTSQMAHMTKTLLSNKKAVLLCGDTGTGKSVMAFKTISSEMPQDVYKPLTLGFSAKTTALMTQDIIDGKLDKRRKGVYGPPMGQTAIIFIDDLNMPEVETYGAQPPIELIRQLIDNGGWYNLKEKTWQQNIDTIVLAAMGPPVCV